MKPKPFSTPLFRALLAIVIFPIGSAALGATLPVNLGAAFDQLVVACSPLCSFAPGAYVESTSAGAISDGSMTTAAYYAGGKGTLSLSLSGAFNGEQGSAQLSYWFEVFGPQGVVPMVLNANGSVSAGLVATDDVTATFGSNLLASGGIEITAGSLNRSVAVPSNAFEIHSAVQVLTNTPYMISMRVTGQGQCCGYRDTLNASVDPTVDFASGFDSSPYSVAFSPDVTPVPLPAAAWLLLSGTAALGAFARRRRSGLAT